MNKIVVRGALVLAVAGGVAAPHAHWLLLSQDRYAMTAVQVETAVVQEYTRAEAQALDRVECEPIRSAPGSSRCEAQEGDEVFGLVLELAGDGGSTLFTAPAAELAAWSGG